MWWISLKSLALWEKVSVWHILIFWTWGLYMLLTCSSVPGDGGHIHSVLGFLFFSFRFSCFCSFLCVLYCITLLSPHCVFSMYPLWRNISDTMQRFSKSYVRMRGLEDWHYPFMEISCISNLFTMCSVTKRSKSLQISKMAENFVS